ncbi:MAG: response regulator [Anaerolineae bacterium]|nr:response regulator [Anaerolineae bacterium]
MSQARILVVDDEALIRRALADYLVECGYDVEMAADGLEGLTRVRVSRFDAVLIDLRMPRLDGLEVITALRAEQPDLPVVVVSGTGVLNDAIEAMRMGAWDYVTKPVRDMNEIVVVVERVLEKARLLAERDRYQQELEQLNRSLEAKVTRQTHDLRVQNRELERLLAQVQAQVTRVQQIVDTVPEGVLLLDADGRIVLANPLAQRDLVTLAPVPEDESAGGPYQLYTQMPLPGLGDCSLASLLEPPPQGLWHEVAGDGQRFEVIARAIEQEVVSGGWVIVIRDVTQEREIARHVRQQERLAAIGQLAAGIAHDFNNHLTAINGYSELLLLGLPTEDPRRADLEEIKKAAGRSASLTRQLLAFSRKQVIQPCILNLNDLVADIERMLQRLIGENIELIAQLDPMLGQVEADPGQIDQVIINLVVNARDAMPDGGKLIVETANVDLDHTFTTRHIDLEPGSYVMLSVADTGIGMDEETQSHLFEPFFTTKERGKGTGLGLATVYGIIKQSGGSVWAYSELGHGSAFKIYLPRVDGVPMSISSEQTNINRLQGTETLLLVEDDDAVCELAQRILQRYRYQVIVARNAQEALDRALVYRNHIDLLITDVIMPEMSGRDLAARLLKVRPGIQVLYMSGYTDEVIVRHGVLEPGVHFIQKPFTALAFLRKVRQVLDVPATVVHQGV